MCLTSAAFNLALAEAEPDAAAEPNADAEIYSDTYNLLKFGAFSPSIDWSAKYKDWKYKKSPSKYSPYKKSSLFNKNPSYKKWKYELGYSKIKPFTSTPQIYHVELKEPEEEVVAEVWAIVMKYDEIKKDWVPAGSSSVPSRVSIYHHSGKETFRVVGKQWLRGQVQGVYR